MSETFDFNNAPAQRSFDVIPDSTVATLQLTVRPGGASDGWLKRSKNNDSEGLDCEVTVVDGEHVHRKFWALFTMAGATSRTRHGRRDQPRHPARHARMRARLPPRRQQPRRRAGAPRCKLWRVRRVALHRPDRRRAAAGRLQGEERPARGDHARSTRMAPSDASRQARTGDAGGARGRRHQAARVGVR